MTTLVLGGGIAGLASAALLARDGHDVTVVERAPQVGGRAGVLEVDGFRFDTGPSWYLMPDAFEHFFHLLGTSTAEQLELVDLDPGYRVFFENHEPLDVRSGLEHSRALFESIEPGAGRALERYAAEASDLYDLAIQKFLYTNFRSPGPYLGTDVVRRAPALARYLTVSLERHVNKRFADPRLRQILQYPAVFLANAPGSTPSLYHLMSRMDLLDGVQYPMGGMRRLIDAVERLALEAGARILTSTEAVGVVTEGKRATGLRVMPTDGGDVEILPAGRIVAACDLHHLDTRLLPGALRSRRWERRDPGMGALLMMLGIDQKLAGIQHHNLVFTEDWDTNFTAIFGRHPRLPRPASVYVCAPSVTDRSVAPEGKENLFVLVPIPADPGVGPAGAGELGRFGDDVIRQIARWTGNPDLPESIIVDQRVGPYEFVDLHHAWRGTALGPAHTLLQSAFFRGGVEHPKVANLLLAGGFTAPGVGLPMCLISAENVLKHTRGDTSAGPLREF